MTVVIFGDIEVALADHFAGRLAELGAVVPVVLAVPPERPKRFVRLVRVGGTQNNRVTDRPRIVGECWDVVGLGARELGALVQAIFNELAPGYVGDIWVNSVGGVGLSFSPDPATNLPRYIVPAELHITGSAAV